MKSLNKNGFKASIHYPIPIHKQDAYKQFNKNNLKYTEKISKDILSLPIYPELEKFNILSIIKIIKKND